MESIGKFEVIRLLGQGAESRVWLARDPDLQRQVAIKRVELPAAANDEQTHTLLREARIVGQLRHPGIVPVYAAGSDALGPYFVYEYVDGETLAQRLARSGALPAADAIALTVALLRALEHAHQRGVIHRDLKPANILLDASGQPRIADFGIALDRHRNGERQAEGLCGTPAYLAPEVIDGGRFGVSSDLYAIGLILWEMLLGQRAYPGLRSFDVIDRIVSQPLGLSPQQQQRLGPRLSHLLSKALAFDPQQRFSSARAMLEAIDLGSGAAQDAVGVAPGVQGTLEFLLRRMRVAGDFPAMSSAIRRIHQLVASEHSSTEALAAEILRDYALTQKLLRLANSAFYRRGPGGRIATVTRAILILGFEAVRNIAISLLLFEHLRGRPNLDRLRDEFLQATLAGLLAHRLAQGCSGELKEEAYIAGMFHRLGRLLAVFYFPEEAAAVDQLGRSDELSEDQAALRVLGLSLGELGVGVARSWGLPVALIDSLQQSGESPATPLAAIAARASQAAQCMAQLPEERRLEALQQLADPAVNAGTVDFIVACDQAWSELLELARTLRIPLQRSFLARRPPDTGVARAMAEPMLPGALDSEGRTAAAGTVLHASERRLALQAGVQELARALLEDRRLEEVLAMGLESLFSAVGFRRVILLLRDGDTLRFSARLGFGQGVPLLVGRFIVDTTAQDLLALALTRDVDVLIKDAEEPRVAERLPPWLRANLAPAGFLLLPMHMQQTAVGMIYADVAQSADLLVADEHLKLMRTVRDQMLLAVRQQRLHRKRTPGVAERSRDTGG